ncbi:MAG TPA: hypothetical protein VMI11_01410 [Actinomycetes bacterium]|nr:hypothetical protein [Actinomycetes bacterium]
MSAGVLVAMTTFRDVQTAFAGYAYAAALVLVGIIAYRGAPLALTALVVMALAWFGIDTLWEGPVVVRLTVHHGITLADSVGFLALAAAGWIAWRRRRT